MTEERTTDRAAVTVVGLGFMGAALARAFVAAGHRTTGWNRTPARAEALGAEGVESATSLRDAAEASPLVVACVSTADVVQELFEPVAASLYGRVLVNLTSTSPEQAPALAAWAEGHGIAYVDGAIMATPPMIATPDAMLLYSGDESAYAGHEDTLGSLGAGQFLGTDAGLASLHDVALLGMMYASQYGVLHALALLGAEGVRPSDFLPLALGLHDAVGTFIPDLAREVEARDYATDVATLDIDHDALSHIVAASSDRGVDSGVFEAIRAHAATVIARGHGPESFSAIIETLRGGEAEAVR